MGLNDLVYWYQKKIGTYDKQQWEKTVEQRIFGGFTNVPMRTAKLKTELIDVDLVRGSSFPKAKPKHGLTMVAWFAMQRLLLLPLHHCWWIQQTSPRIYALFLLLYGLQLFNMLTYFSVAQADQANIVSSAEILMPVGMMFILCMVHSQIVSTNSGPSTITGYNRLRIRRSRHERCRSGKLRSRRNLRTANEPKTSHESATEKSSKIQCDVSPSVRFAKKVSIESPANIGKVQLEVKPVIPINEEEKIKSRSPIPSPVKEVVIHPINEPPDDAEENPENVDIVHQDDDGFESLNGNVSSDNDRATAHREASRVDDSKKTNEIGTSENFENRGNRNEQEPNNHDWRAAVVSEVSRKIEINSDREGDPCDVPQPSKTVTREGKQECESEEEGECDEAAINHLTEATTSATEWMGVTTNSDVCSYSSDLEESDAHSETNFSYADFVEHPFSWELELPPSILLSSSCTASDRVSCTIWTRRDIKKAELSVLDISSAIIARVESMPEGMDYFYGGLVLSFMLSLIPSIRRLSDEFGSESSHNSTGSIIASDLAHIGIETWSERLCNIIDVAFGATLWERSIVLTLAFEKFALSWLLFFLLAVAERTFKQRLLYAKLFSHLTSSRRARKSDLPHFRLNKVRNIKTWLSVRSYLKRRGPQRSVDVIVSGVFIVTLLLLSFVSLELIKVSMVQDVNPIPEVRLGRGNKICFLSKKTLYERGELGNFLYNTNTTFLPMFIFSDVVETEDLDSLHSQFNVEALLWSFALGIYILRFMTLGTKINKKYRNLSVLITEQINLYLQIEQKPHKKDELMVANSVLKLAADLIKELECPFKISGLSANPYLYTITKVVLLSALSGVLSELLGFKLKLHKITIK